LTKRFPNANSNYVLTKFNFLVKANGNHTVEYRFVNENPAPQYVFDELQKGQRFLVVSGYLEYAHARSGKQYIYKFIYQVEPPYTQLGPNKLRVSLSENADL